MPRRLARRVADAEIASAIDACQLRERRRAAAAPRGRLEPSGAAPCQREALEAREPVQRERLEADAL